jgi:hypothetical protein
MANEVCYRTFGLDQPWSIETYMSVGGYEAWKRILAGQLTPDQVIDEVKKIRFARTWRRRLPDRPEMDLYAAQYDSAEVHGLQFRRVGTGDL